MTEAYKAYLRELHTTELVNEAKIATAQRNAMQMQLCKNELARRGVTGVMEVMTRNDIFPLTTK
jgi:hypothetical protein